MSIKTVYVLHHSHVDRGYMHHPSITESLQSVFLDHAIDELEDDAHRLVWTIETTAPLRRWLDDASTRQIAQLQKLVAAGRIGIGAMAWHTTPLASRADWVRMLRPLDTMRTQTGDRLRTAIQHDVNGLPWGAVSLMRSYGIDTLLTGVNIDHGGFPGDRHDIWDWVGHDGSLVRVYAGEQYGTFQRVFRIHSHRSLGDMEEGWEEYAASIQVPGDRDWIMLTATAERIPDCNGPWPLLARRIDEWNATARSPRLVLTTPEGVRAAIQACDPVATRTGDWTDYWNFGCGATAQATARSRYARTLINLAREFAPSLEDRWERDLERAEELVCLYGEHTWGARGTLPAPPRHDAWQQATTKINLAAEAAGIALPVVRARWDRWLGNPVRAVGSRALAVVNTDDMPRWMTPQVLVSWLDGTWRHGLQELLAADDEIAGALKPAARISPVLVPAHSCRVIEAAEVHTVPSPDCITGVDRASTPSYEVAWRESDGAIASCWHNGAPLLAGDASMPPLHPIVEYVHGPGSARDLRRLQHETDHALIHANHSCWNPDWPATRIALDNVSSIECVHDAAGIHLTRTWELEPFGGWWLLSSTCRHIRTKRSP
jgi:hypothetical protein